MSQWQWRYYPEAVVQFDFTNRTKIKLAHFVSLPELQREIDQVRLLRITDEEAAYLFGLRGKSGKFLFDLDYLNDLMGMTLPTVKLGIVDGQLTIETEGPWWIVTFWETIIMSIVNELYFRAILKQSGKTKAEVFEEGLRRLVLKIRRLQEWPSIRFSDFGTRRRFSREWQEIVYACLMDAFGGESRFLGTSNMALAMKYGQTPVGTFAHENPMVVAALNDGYDETLRESQKTALRQWEEMYGPDLLVALSDTFGSDAFLEDFVEFAKSWGGVRHDSGDPFEFGEMVIAFYQKMGIDPMEKAIVFSDGLTDKTITELFYRFQHRIWMVFGWGTNLTNDLGFDALSIVMKAMAARWSTETDWHFTCKLSDNPKKAMSKSPEVKMRYARVFNHRERKAIECVY
jgi:nicotinate phosphoribosyltransferase